MPRTPEANQLVASRRREEITQVASQLFIQFGYDNVRITDIAEKIGISQGLLYRYFSDKEGLFAAIVEKGVAEVRLVINSPDRTEESATTWLIMFIEKMLGSIYQNPQRLQVLLIGARFPGRILELVNSSFEELRVYTIKLIVEAQEEGIIVDEDPFLLAGLLLSTLQGIAFGIVHFASYQGKLMPTAKQVFRIIRR